MSSPEILKALQYYEKVFQRLYCQPIAVNHCQQLRVVTGRKAGVAYWTTFISTGLCGGGLTSAIIITAVIQRDLPVPPWKIGVQLLLLMLCLALPVITATVINYGDVIVSFWNYAVTLQEIPPPTPDFLGMSLRLTLHIGTGAICAFPICLSHFELDPISIGATLFFGQVYNSLSATARTLLAIIRVGCVMHVVYQLLALYMFLMILACVGIRIFTNAIIGLKKQPGLFQFLRRYNMYRCLIKLVEGISSFALCMITCLCFTITVISTFASIKLYGVIPIPLFLLAPTLMCAGPVFAFSTIFPVIFVHEGSAGLLHRHKTFVTGSDFSYMKRKYVLWRLRETYPLTFYAGVGDFRLFKFKRSTKLSYVEIVLYFSISFILSVPTHSLLHH